MFEEFVQPQYSVIDFGCGGGFLLNSLSCKNKIGVEINDFARRAANENGIKTVQFSSEVADSWADVVVSNHAMEHVLSPSHELEMLRQKLRSGGTIIFVVPWECEGRYDPADINKHLFTWSPLNLGNLFSAAGFDVKESIEIIHRWPPDYLRVWAKHGPKSFHQKAVKFGAKNRELSQCRVVAKKM